MAARGRPSRFTHAIAERICEELAAGKSLVAVCEAEGMPAESTVRLWVLDDREGFAAMYARAREVQAERWADEILGIADEATRDTIIRTGKDGTEYEAENTEWINRSRLRVDTRKWLLSKMLPKKYGEKLDVTSGGERIPAGGLSGEDLAVLERLLRPRSK